MMVNRTDRQTEGVVVGWSMDGDDESSLLWDKHDKQNFISKMVNLSSSPPPPSHLPDTNDARMTQRSV